MRGAAAAPAGTAAAVAVHLGQATHRAVFVDGNGQRPSFLASLDVFVSEEESGVSGTCRATKGFPTFPTYTTVTTGVCAHQPRGMNVAVEEIHRMMRSQEKKLPGGPSSPIQA